MAEDLSSWIPPGGRKESLQTGEAEERQEDGEAGEGAGGRAVRNTSPHELEGEEPSWRWEAWGHWAL